MSSVVTFGSDPEMMLKDREGHLVSAIGRVKGTKEKKQDLGNGHYCFYDNVLVEMNVKASANEEEMIENFRDCFSRLSRVVSPLTLNVQASANYPKKECEHPDAKVFGCDPEYCAYDLVQIPAPVREDTFRSAGGHIHLGATKESYPLLAPMKGDDRMERDWGRVWVIRMMDLFVGLPSLLIDHDPTSAARRALYGSAGTHRPKEEYGVEYRPTSNFWLSTPKIAKLVYKLAMHSVRFVAEGGHKKLWHVDPNYDNAKHRAKAYSVKDLREIINTSNIKKAHKMLEEVVKPNLPNDLWTGIFVLAEKTAPARNGNNFYIEWGIA